jgi:hypothetical protein
MVKVMFLTCIASPRFHEEGNCVLNRMLKIFSFYETTYAKKTSIYRPAGTIKTKPIMEYKNLLKECSSRNYFLLSEVNGLRRPR